MKKGSVYRRRPAAVFPALLLAGGCASGGLFRHNLPVSLPGMPLPKVSVLKFADRTKDFILREYGPRGKNFIVNMARQAGRRSVGLTLKNITGYIVEDFRRSGAFESVRPIKDFVEIADNEMLLEGELVEATFHHRGDEIPIPDTISLAIRFKLSSPKYGDVLWERTLSREMEGIWTPPPREPVAGMLRSLSAEALREILAEPWEAAPQTGLEGEGRLFEDQPSSSEGRFAAEWDVDLSTHAGSGLDPDGEVGFSTSTGPGNDPEAALFISTGTLSPGSDGPGGKSSSKAVELESTEKPGEGPEEVLKEASPIPRLSVE